MTLRISSYKARLILLSVWLAFFLFNGGAILYLYSYNWIEKDNFKAGLSQINSLYATYLGVMIAFFYTDASSKALKQKHAGAPFLIALVVSLIWNIFISVFVTRLLLQLGVIEDSIKQMGDFGPMFPWLIAAAIGFYFGKSSK